METHEVLDLVYTPEEGQECFAGTEQECNDFINEQGDATFMYKVVPIVRKMMDLMYFGYDYEVGSRQFEIDFKKEVKEKFDNVELRDAYDDIKGYRQEVYLNETQKDDYHAWLIGKGWFEMSLNMQLMRMDGDLHDELKRIFELTKIKYPEAFKSVS